MTDNNNIYDVREAPDGGYPLVWGLSQEEFNALPQAMSEGKRPQPILNHRVLPDGRWVRYGRPEPPSQPPSVAHNVRATPLRSPNDFGRSRGGRRPEDSDDE